MKLLPSLALTLGVTIGLQFGNRVLGQAPVESPGLMKMEVWTGLSTTENVLDSTLLADPRYPNSPSEVLYTFGLSSRPAYPDDTHEG